MAKKKVEEEIDEDFIIASMNMGSSSGLARTPIQSDEKEQQVAIIKVAEPLKTTPIPKEESKRRKTKDDYETLFIKQTVVSGRQGKTTYLREEFYNRILKIIVLYNNPKLSVFAYVDAVLEHHFDIYEQEIMKIYNNKNSAPY